MRSSVLLELADVKPLVLKIVTALLEMRALPSGLLFVSKEKLSVMPWRKANGDVVASLRCKMGVSRLKVMEVIPLPRWCLELSVSFLRNIWSGNLPSTRLI